jgi:endo-1,3(4)-beta-glucanase
MRWLPIAALALFALACDDSSSEAPADAATPDDMGTGGMPAGDAAPGTGGTTGLDASATDAASPGSDAGSEPPDTGAGGGPGADAGSPPAPWALGDPISTEAPDLPTIRHDEAPGPRWGDAPGPHPTNAWWTNAVLGAGDLPLNLLPYVVKVLNTGVEVSEPFRVATETFIYTAHDNDLTLGAAEALIPPIVAAHDALSVTFEWADPAGPRMRTPLVRGAAYVTARYTELTPRITTPRAVLDLRVVEAGRRFEIDLDDGTTWLVYTTAPIELARGAGGLTAPGAWSGDLRVARRPEDPAARMALDTSANAIPIGGEVGARIDGAEATLTFSWISEGEGPVLGYALPHHVDTLVEAPLPTLARRTIRGTVAGVLGDVWTMRWTLPELGWQAPRAIDPAHVDAVREALTRDAVLEPEAWDTYRFGKQAARMGRHMLIAEALGENGVARRIGRDLAEALAPWLEGRNADPLVYDEVWGGVVPRDAARDRGAQFGSGYYNDHHFHYGYLVYAAAALARHDPAWAESHGDWVRALIRDIGNPSDADPHFPVTRSFDWFVGHSWAAGLAAFGDGRNQESTSEAVNAWYAVKLFGDAVGDANISDLGWLLASLEIRSAQRYWQVFGGSDIYEPPYDARRVVGVLWSLKVDHATFFGANLEFIHGIQWLPFTPATEALLDPAWMAEAWPIVATALDRANPPIEPGWRSFVAMARGIVDPAAAWADLDTQAGWDDGNSETNARWWVATRPR